MAKRHFPIEYSRNSTLTVFLESLSYHLKGAKLFADKILSAPRTSPTRMLDIGAGDGQFSTALVSSLLTRGHRVSNILAIDPDPDNLLRFQQRLEPTDFRVSTLVGEFENLPSLVPESRDVVIASHSLYELLENPSISDEFIIDVIQQLRKSTAPRGVLLFSLAGEGSPAYRVKAEVLSTLRIEDRSAYGEQLLKLLTKASLDAEIEFIKYSSYMDASYALKDPEHTSAWIRYFCRLTHEEYSRLGWGTAAEILRNHAVELRKLSGEMQKEFLEYPAYCGSPTPSTLVLPHTETLIVLKKN